MKTGKQRKKKRRQKKVDKALTRWMSGYIKNTGKFIFQGNPLYRFFSNEKSKHVLRALKRGHLSPRKEGLGNQGITFG